MREQIICISNDNIDKKKYDSCIDDSPFGTIYALSWYLDIASPSWKLIATEDYSVVMPLPQKRKFGLTYIAQPHICQQLGIFSASAVTPEIFDAFVKKLDTLYCLLAFNSGNAFRHPNLRQRANYILFMNKPYEELRNRYNGNTSADLKKIDKLNLIYDKETDILPYLDLIPEHSPHYEGKMFNVLKRLATEVDKRGRLCGRIIYDKNKKDILAMAGFFCYKNRFYYLAPMSTEEGKRYRAMRFLIDQFIQEHAGTDSILDFEGSTIPSVAQFYEGFGAIFEPYPRYYKNYIPFVSKLKF